MLLRLYGRTTLPKWMPVTIHEPGMVSAFALWADGVSRHSQTSLDIIWFVRRRYRFGYGTGVYGLLNYQPIWPDAGRPAAKPAFPGLFAWNDALVPACHHTVRFHGARTPVRTTAAVLCLRSSSLFFGGACIPPAPGCRRDAGGRLYPYSYHCCRYSLLPACTILLCILLLFSAPIIVYIPSCFLLFLLPEDDMLLMPGYCLTKAGRHYWGVPVCYAACPAAARCTFVPSLRPRVTLFPCMATFLFSFAFGHDLLCLCSWCVCACMPGRTGFGLVHGVSAGCHLVVPHTFASPACRCACCILLILRTPLRRASCGAIHCLAFRLLCCVRGVPLLRFLVLLVYRYFRCRAGSLRPDYARVSTLFYA